jgi:hypothetical protein
MLFVGLLKPLGPILRPHVKIHCRKKISTKILGLVRPGFDFNRLSLQSWDAKVRFLVSFIIRLEFHGLSSVEDGRNFDILLQVPSLSMGAIPNGRD